MAWSDLVNTLDAACLATFGTAVTFTPQDGSGGWLDAQPIVGIIMQPAMAEDYPQGFGPGTAVLRFWVNFETITPSPRHGDQIGFNGATYVVQDVEASIGGAAVLKLRVE